jgi:hypothetical protein
VLGKVPVVPSFFAVKRVGKNRTARPESLSYRDKAARPKGCGGFVVRWWSEWCPVGVGPWSSTLAGVRDQIGPCSSSVPDTWV